MTIKSNKWALRCMTALSVLSEDLGWKLGYDEASENFAIERMSFHPVSNITAQRMRHEHFLTFLGLVSCHSENIFMNLPPGSWFCCKSSWELLKEQLQQWNFSIVLFFFLINEWYLFFVPCTWSTYSLKFSDQFYKFLDRHQQNSSHDWNKAGGLYNLAKMG